MDRLRQDIRHGARTLMRSPLFAVTAMLTLGLGIGANTAMFSFVDAVLWRPLPYPDPDRLVMVWQDFGATGGPRQEWFTPPDYEDLVAQSRTLEAATPLIGWNPNLTGAGEPVQLSGAVVSAAYFDVAGVSPVMGRGFNAGDAVGDANVVVVSDGLWRSVLGGEGEVPGRTIQLNGEPFTVIGVMPAGFQAPFQTAEIWRPYTRAFFTNCGRGCYVMQVLARIRPGVSIEQASADVAAVGQGIVEVAPDEKAGLVVRAVPLHEQIAGPVRPALVALLGAVGLLLLIACVNIASLLLSRAAEREREMAVRSAIGASRRTLLRQLLTETVILGAAGGAAGLVLAFWSVDLLVAMTPAGTPRIADVSVDGRALAFGALLALATAIVFGLVPALHLSRIDIAGSLRESGGTRSSVSRRRMRSVMVAAEVAIALVLLMGAGLMVRSFVRLQAVDPGFEPERALAVQLVLPRARYESAQQANAFYDRLLERVEAQPGVVAAGAVSVLPMSGSNTDVSFLIEGRPEPTSRENSPVADYRSVTSGYLEASGMRLQRGRWVTAADRADAGRVVVVNETMARRYWPNEDAIGRRILFGGSNPTATTVVGVVADVHHNGLDQAVRPEMYLSHLQIGARAMAIVVRTEGDPVSMAGRVRASVREMDTELPIGSQTTLDELVASSVAMPRLIVAFLGFFAFVSVLLAAIGVYGVTAQSVSLRRPEIGIRMALGANARTVVLLIVGQTMLIGAAGLAAGMVGAFALSGALGKLLFELSPKDPATFIVIPLVLAVVVLVASWTPARRAASVDPMKSLRTE